MVLSWYVWLQIDDVQLGQCRNTSHIYIYILHFKKHEFPVSKWHVFFARFHHQSLGQHTGRWTFRRNGANGPRIRSSPIGKYRCRRSSKASWFQWSFHFFSASHAGLWHCKTNPMLHLVKTKPKKGNNNLDRTNLHEKRQFFWANLGNETNLYFPMGGGSRNQTSSADLTTMFRHVVFFAAPWQLKKRKR